MILVCHLSGAVICGLLIPGEKKRMKFPPRPLPFFTVLADCARALLTVALCMMLGGTAARMAGCALPFLPSGITLLIHCALEVSGGVQGLIRHSPPLLLPLICAACSFGGLSILLQNAAFWQKRKIALRQLFLIRLLHAAISFFLCLFAEKIL